MPQPVTLILQGYFSGFMMRFSTKTFTTSWVPLEFGMAMGSTISPSLFVLAMSDLTEGGWVQYPRGSHWLHMSPIKAFMDGHYPDHE